MFIQLFFQGRHFAAIYIFLVRKPAGSIVDMTELMCFLSQVHKGQDKAPPVDLQFIWGFWVNSVQNISSQPLFSLLIIFMIKHILNFIF